jgi:glycosyltransferase involved in cell wall biosynthesis
MELRTIVINGRYLSQPITGVQRVARELIHALDTEIAEGRISSGSRRLMLVAPRGARLPALRAIDVRHAGRTSGHCWEQIEFPWLFRHALKVSLCGAAPFAAADQIVTFHDTAVFSAPDSFTIPFRTWYRLLFRLQGRLAASVLTVSEFSRSELAGRCSIPSGKLEIVSPAADHVLGFTPDPSILLRLGLSPSGYALCVGSLHPNKNLAAVQAAAALLNNPPFDFVIVGANMQSAFRRSEPESGALKYTGRLNDSELCALYRGAFCFIAPSRYEGFGIPPLEAMSCGCPVIAARAAAIPETCGNAALYFEPDRPSELAGLVAELYSDPRLQQTLRERGLERASDFSWQRSAHRFWQAIVKVSNGTSPHPRSPGEELCHD